MHPGRRIRFCTTFRNRTTSAAQEIHQTLSRGSASMTPSLMPHAVCWSERSQPHLDHGGHQRDHVPELLHHLRDAVLSRAPDAAGDSPRVGILSDRLRAVHRGLRFDPPDGRGHHMDSGVLDRCVDQHHHRRLVGIRGRAVYPACRDLGFGINDYAQRLANTEAEKAQIEESLLDARRLEEWNRMSAVVTHEINNPLAAIQNMMFLIEISPGATPEIVQMARAIGGRSAPDRVIDALDAGVFPADRMRRRRWTCSLPPSRCGCCWSR